MIRTRTTNERALTAGEEALVASVFGDTLDTRGVTFRQGKWWWFQPARVVMAPDGHIWFHPRNPAWREDFSDAPLPLRAFVIHEMVHVWQRQRGINLLLRRYPFSRYRYLPLIPGKPFHAYGVEQQAEIVRHAYLLREGGRVPGAPRLETYAALIPFGRWEAPALIA